MSQNYIFCPLCGGVKWISDKSGYINAGRIETNKCGACKKFTWTTHTALVAHQVLVGITKTTSFSVQADISHYRITVFYHKNSTQFQDLDTNEVILTVNSAVAFNWYKNEELVSKIKTYILFS